MGGEDIIVRGGTKKEKKAVRGAAGAVCEVRVVRGYLKFRIIVPDKSPCVFFSVVVYILRAYKALKIIQTRSTG
jgi:hypothetical protein